ncbi:putative magnesium transporter MRS2 [Helianthus annuus]|nr:putative magnesium transporter MRS2 [Helianthus annuus]KAJ0596428.1 putative magnesium transporter MRS2 [Helianthus annuus]KAJ0757088.1 putative magnesium transporter MRS2 [Helianthus annuus]KAJ0760821.1 putative magnesium transporter MRS2 [Helianthus annuus]KAJ0926155.1 putative magnesium transporter MRS2 [Helianthus annuus]
MRGDRMSKTNAILEEDTARTTAHLNVGGGLRKKASGVRQWLLLDSTGQTQVVEAGKHTVMRRTGLPARDLRILDPILSYPSTLLGRERAIVINLEHIKAIITAHEVLLLNSKDPSVAPFVQELQRRILRHHHATAAQEGMAMEEGRASTSSWQEGIHSLDGLKLLQFEFIALEACLEAACSCLGKEARTLEEEAHPALDKLTTKICTLNLERVRQIKSRLVDITGRVQKVRDELEHLLDDDEDMFQMYLSDKLEQRLDNASSFNKLDDVDESEMNDRFASTLHLTPPTFEVSENFSFDRVHRPMKGNENIHEGVEPGRVSHGARTSIARSSMTNKHHDVEELEMLLEAYFVQIDGTFNKLSTLREYVDDTEDYINIMLDDKQNHLLQMGVMLSTMSLIVGALVVMAGAFGMNINIQLFNGDTAAEKEAGMRKFLFTVGGGTTGGIFLYVIAVTWYKNKWLIQ